MARLAAWLAAALSGIAAAGTAVLGGIWIGISARGPHTVPPGAEPSSPPYTWDEAILGVTAGLAALAVAAGLAFACYVATVTAQTRRMPTIAVHRPRRLVFLAAVWALLVAALTALWFSPE